MYRCRECKAFFSHTAEFRHILVYDPYEIFDVYMGCPFCGGVKIRQLQEENDEVDKM